MFFLQIVRSVSQEIAMSLQPGTAAIYWAIVMGAVLLAVLVMYQGVAGSDERTSPIDSSKENLKEDQVLGQAA